MESSEAKGETQIDITRKAKLETDSELGPLLSVIPEASFTNPEVDEIIGEDEIGGDIISHIIGDETRYSDSVEGILGLDIIDEILGI